jgi:hypothetical protein
MVDMAITGKYRIYENGSLVSEEENLLTTIGKREFLGIVAGTSPRISRLGLGIMGGTAAASDQTLFFPLVDTPVEFSVPLFGGASSRVVYKSRLVEGVSGVIYEIGCYNGPEINDPLLVSFGDDIDAPGTVPGLAGGSSANDVRIGPVSPLITTTDPFVVTGQMSAGSVLSTDTIALALKGSAASTVRIDLQDSVGKVAFCSYAFTGTSYQVVKKFVSEWTVDVGFDWKDIVSCTATRTGAASSIILDGLAVLAPLQSGQLLSHAVLGTPLVKRAGVRMDVEYELTMNLA